MQQQMNDSLMDETTPELQEYYAKMDRPMQVESLTEDPEGNTALYINHRVFCTTRSY